MGIEKIRFYIQSYDAKILVAGCLPDIASKLLIPFGEKVKIINWKNDIKLLDEIFLTSKSLAEFNVLMTEKRICSNAHEFRKQFSEKPVTFHDQFIKVLVSEGCNHNCTYCSELNTFPPYKSFDIEYIKNGVSKLVKDTEVFDVMLLADSLGQYGCDIGTNLPALIRCICSIDPRIKIALNNLHLADFLEYKAEILSLIKDGAIKHINLPIQSASDGILRQMKRQYTSAEISDVFGLFNQIDFKEFDTHIIIGFPTETEYDFKKTVDLLVKYKPKYALVSKYMESDAAKSSEIYPKVPNDVILARMERIETCMNDAGIICNCDGNELSVDRLRRLDVD
jgi:threonylcarbamoyladenosine tRNA methylthiotransferase CDKAL1